MNVCKEFPIKAFLNRERWEDDAGYTYIPLKTNNAVIWIKETFNYAEYPVNCVCFVMNYIVFRFKTYEDAVYFKLIWD